MTTQPQPERPDLAAEARLIKIMQTRGKRGFRYLRSAEAPLIRYTRQHCSVCGERIGFGYVAFVWPNSLQHLDCHRQNVATGAQQ